MDLIHAAETGCDPYAHCFTLPNHTACAAAGSAWVQPHYGSFDNVPEGALLLFEMAGLERWPDVMFWAMAAAAQDHPAQAPAVQLPWSLEWAHLVPVIFFILWVFLASFVILSLFVGVVVDNFQRMKQEADGTVFLSDGQRQWVKVMKDVTKLRAPKPPVPPRGAFRRLCFRVASARIFELSITVLIVANTAVLCADGYPPEPFRTDVLKVLNWVFSVIYFFECILKLVGLGGKQYFSDRWNVFDFLLVLAAIVDFGLSVGGSGTEIGGFNPLVVRTLRLFRVMRILRLLRGSQSLLHCLRTLLISLPQLANISALLLLLLVIYSSIGMFAFYNVNREHAAELDDLVNFDSFWYSILTLTRCVTGESWNGVMHDLMITEASHPGRCTDAAGDCGSPYLAIVYFVTFTFLANLVSLNMLIAVILENFAGFSADASQVISQRQMAEFQQAWQALDVSGSNTIPTAMLPQLLSTLQVTGCHCDHLRLLLHHCHLHSLTSSTIPSCRCTRGCTPSTPTSTTRARSGSPSRGASRCPTTKGASTSRRPFRRSPAPSTRASAASTRPSSRISRRDASRPSSAAASRRRRSSRTSARLR